MSDTQRPASMRTEAPIPKDQYWQLPTPPPMSLAEFRYHELPHGIRGWIAAGLGVAALTGALVGIGLHDSHQHNHISPPAARSSLQP